GELARPAAVPGSPGSPFLPGPARRAVRQRDDVAEPLVDLQRASLLATVPNPVEDDCPVLLVACAAVVRGTHLLRDLQVRRDVVALVQVLLDCSEQVFLGSRHEDGPACTRQGLLHASEAMTDPRA